MERDIELFSVTEAFSYVCSLQTCFPFVRLQLILIAVMFVARLIWGNL